MMKVVATKVKSWTLNQDNWVPVLCGINISRPWLVLGTKTPWLGLGKYYDTWSNEFEVSNWDIMN